MRKSFAPVRRLMRILCSTGLWVGATTVQATPESPLFNVSHQAGPTAVDLYTYGYRLLGNEALLMAPEHKDNSAPPDDTGMVRLETPLGASPSGGHANAMAASVPDGSWFGATVQAPQHFPNPSSHLVGGAAGVVVTRTYRKDSEDAFLSFKFSFIDLQGGWEKEFGQKCPPERPGCQWASFRTHVDLWAMTGDVPLWSADNRLTVRSIGTALTDPGYEIEPEGFFSYQWRNSRYGFEAGSGGNLIENRLPIDLSGVGVGDLFVVQHQVWVGAVDTGSHIAPGRNVEAAYIDPLSFSAGNLVRYQGLTAWEDLQVNPPGQVSEPPMLALLPALLGAAMLGARRRRPYTGLRASRNITDPDPASSASTTKPLR